MKSMKPVLLVEDDQVDAMTVKRAFKELNIENKLVVSENGEEALDYLDRDGSEFPCLILLDINMPRMDGIEFLKITKNNEKFKMIPVVVFTTSKEDKDRNETFSLGAAGYMVKPVNYDDSVDVLKIVESYWAKSELPEELCV